MEIEHEWRMYTGQVKVRWLIFLNTKKENTID